MALEDTPYGRRVAKRTTGSHGNASEQRLAKKLGGRATPGSGNMKGAKGDINLQTMLVEAKSTVNATMSLEHAWLVKIAHEALGKGKTPALTVSFVDPTGKAKKSGDWIMVPLHYWQEISEE